MGTLSESPEKGVIENKSPDTPHLEATPNSEDIEVATDTQAPQESTEDTPEQKKAARNYRWRLIMGLLLPSILEALDTTIIAAALSFIASEFSKRFNFNSQSANANSSAR